MESLLHSLLGFLLGAWVVILVERLRKPKLKLHLIPTDEGTYPANRPAKRAKVIKLQVENEVLPRWARWMSRSAAVQCRGSVTFHHMDGQNIFGRAMPVKWLRTAEALPMEIRSPDGAGVVGYLVDPLRIMAESRDDIAPGETALFDVVVRFDDEPECYGWNLESYQSNPPWRNTKWKLPHGRYLVRAEVFSGDQSAAGIFRLVNEGPADSFRLMRAMASDRVF